MSPTLRSHPNPRMYQSTQRRKPRSSRPSMLMLSPTRVLEHLLTFGTSSTPLHLNSRPIPPLLTTNKPDTLDFFLLDPLLHFLLWGMIHIYTARRYGTITASGVVSTSKCFFHSCHYLGRCAPIRARACTMVSLQ